jgi:putative transposase
MPQSLSRLYVHLIFSTKDRTPLITETVRDPLHAYMSGILQNLGCFVVLINSMEDHVHLLFDLARTVALSKVVEETKKSSTKWMKTQSNTFFGFAWQAGYGAFAVSESNIAAVRAYVAQQKEHHRKSTFEDEFRQILERHHVSYDERYLWD